VEVPTDRVTAYYDEEKLSLLKESLKTAGTIQPPVVVKTEGGFIVVDGLHRIQEARERGESVMDMVIYEGSPADAMVMNLVLNNLRGKTKASEMAKVIGKLFDEEDMPIEDMVKRTGYPRDYIERLIKVSRASPTVVEALDQETIGVGQAYEISRLPTVEIQEEFVATAQVYGTTIKALKEQVDAILDEVEKIKRQPPQQQEAKERQPLLVNCAVCQTLGKMSELKAVFLCPECYSGVWRSAKNRESVSTKKPVEGEGG